MLEVAERHNVDTESISTKISGRNFILSTNGSFVPEADIQKVLQKADYRHPASSAVPVAEVNRLFRLYSINT